MRVDGLEETEDDPCIDRDDMQALREEAVDQRAKDGTGAEDEDFSRVGVLGRETEGGRVFMVDLVDVLVQNASV